MKKMVLISMLNILFFCSASAAIKSDSLRIYYQNSGKKVSTKDSADYFRVILPPDPDIDKDLYRIIDYYPNGKTKSVATSLTGTGNLVFDGASLNFFPNGKRKSTVQYKNGWVDGLVTNYYPNGKLFNILKFEGYNNGYRDDYYRGSNLFIYYRYHVKVIELRDSTGKILASNGTGHVIIYDDNFKNIITEGELKNNKKEGEWTGLIADSGKFTCVYHKDEIKSGKSYLRSGREYTFQQFELKAVYSDGMEAFQEFITKNLQYPENTKHKVKGTVTVGFYVETNGTLSNVSVIKSLVRSLDEEALRVIRLSPLWNPETKFGIPVRSYHTAWVTF